VFHSAKIYLSDEWGCPNRVPVIGIPFYLVDEGLSRLESKLTDIETENDKEVLTYLRHEAVTPLTMHTGSTGNRSGIEFSAVSRNHIGTSISQSHLARSLSAILKDGTHRSIPTMILQRLSRYGLHPAQDAEMVCGTPA